MCDTLFVQSFTLSSRQETRESAAHLLGVLTQHLSSTELAALAQELLSDTASEVRTLPTHTHTTHTHTHTHTGIRHSVRCTVQSWSCD